MTPKKTRRALGRGLSNLIPVSDESNNVECEVLGIAINAIQANPYQPRRTFHDEDIRGLAESIQSQGLLQPIILRKKGDGHELVSGERRLRALKYLNSTIAPCIIKERVSDTKMLEMALVEISSGKISTTWKLQSRIRSFCLSAACRIRSFRNRSAKAEVWSPTPCAS